MKQKAKNYKSTKRGGKKWHAMLPKDGKTRGTPARQIKKKTKQLQKVGEANRANTTDNEGNKHGGLTLARLPNLNAALLYFYSDVIS